MSEGELKKAMHNERIRWIGDSNRDFAVNQSFSYFEKVLDEAKKEAPPVWTEADTTADIDTIIEQWEDWFKKWFGNPDVLKGEQST